jgi:hypothetical protein
MSGIVLACTVSQRLAGERQPAAMDERERRI